MSNRPTTNPGGGGGSSSAGRFFFGVDQRAALLQIAPHRRRGRGSNRLLGALVEWYVRSVDGDVESVDVPPSVDWLSDWVDGGHVHLYSIADRPTDRRRLINGCFMLCTPPHLDRPDPHNAPNTQTKTNHGPSGVSAGAVGDVQPPAAAARGGRGPNRAVEGEGVEWGGAMGGWVGCMGVCTCMLEGKG